MSRDVDYPQGCLPIEPTTSVSQQIERLRILSGRLFELKKNEEAGTPNRFRRLFAHLSQNAFLEISNNDIRILLSSCLASILRIFSPEIPVINPEELKDVYIHIFRSLRGLGEFTQDNPKFNQYYELLQTVGQEEFLKPISLFPDEGADNKLDEESGEEEKQPCSQTIVTRVLLKEILTIPCCSGWSKNIRRKTVHNEPKSSDEFNDDDDDEEDKIKKVEQLLLDIARKAIGQLDTFPNEVLDVLFYHIINPQRTNFKDARNLAESIIDACLADDYFLQTIHLVMTTAAKKAELPKEFELTGSNNRNKFFEVLRYLHYISYDLVSGAIQGHNFWLQSEIGAYRKEAVRIVGMLTRDPHCQFGIDINDATWTSFLAASTDTDVEVRHEFVEQAKEVLMSNHSHLRGHVISALVRLGLDSSEIVRISVVEAVTQVAKSKLEVISDKLLKVCAERMKDKKPKVRERAIKVLMDLYFHVMTSRPQPFYSRDGNNPVKDASESSQSYTESEKESVKFIPNHVFELYRILKRSNSHADSKFTIERYLQKYLVPFEVEATGRVEILAQIYRGLDEISRMMFGDIITRSSQLRRAMMGILSQIGSSKEMTPENSAELKDRLRRICQLFPEPLTLEKAMVLFVNQIGENEETFNLVKKIMADRYTTAENQKSVIQLKNILENKIGAKANQTAFRHFIDRVCPLSFDVCAAKEITNLVARTVTAKLKMENWADGCFETDLDLLKLLTDNYAHIFTDGDIVEKIRTEILMSEEPLAVEAAIHALSRIVTNSNFRAEMETDAIRKKKWFLGMIKNLKEFVTREEPELRRACKLATRLLANLLGKEKAVEFFDNEVDTLVDRLDIENPGAANAFQVLAEINCINPSHYLSQMLEIIDSDRIGHSLMTSPQYSDDDPIEFNEKTHMEKQPWPKYTMAKVYAAKFAAKVLSSIGQLKNEEKQIMEGSSQKLIDILCEVLEKNGEFGDKQCSLEKARIRCASAACLLKLASLLTYRIKVHTRLFKNMAYMITDESYCVRLFYAFHVKKGLSRQLPIEFAACYGLLNLVEEDIPSNGFKFICINQAHQIFADRNEARADFLKLNYTKRAMYCSETVVAYVVWLLANYHKLERIEDNANKDDSVEVLNRKLDNVNLLSKVQESLWLVIEALVVAKCNMQKVWKVLEKLKTCGDKSARTHEKLSIAQIRQHNKKLWALCDLGISMMLYRAKLQMEDQDSREAGFNLQFFYVCNEADNSDPSNCYAPDVLINDEKQRNGKQPKLGRVFQISDLTSEFTPPPQSNESIASNSLKNISKRGGNTSLNKTKNGKTTKRRRSAGGSKYSDDDEDTTLKAIPAVKKTRSKRGTYDLPEEDEEDEEVLPLPKRRGAPPVSSEPSSSNGTTRKSASPKKQTSKRMNGKDKAEAISEESSDDEEEKEAEDSLDNIELSPILSSSTGRSRRSARTTAVEPKITASTPLVFPNPKSIKRKRVVEVVEEQEDEEEEDEEEEKVEADKQKKVLKSPTPKKRTSARRGPSTSSEITPKSTPVKKATEKKKKNSPAKTNGTSPKKNKYGLTFQEDDEYDEGPSTSAPRVRTRTSTRISKK